MVLKNVNAWTIKYFNSMANSQTQSDSSKTLSVQVLVVAEKYTICYYKSPFIDSKLAIYQDCLIR